jgi:hydrogenase expression/formation protein HypC
MCVAYPGQVLEIAGDMALLAIDRRTLRASTMLVPEAAVGDWVVVAAGAILRIVDPDEAREIREMLDEALRDEPSMEQVSTAQQEA